SPLQSLSMSLALNDPAPIEPYTLSLHDALPILRHFETDGHRFGLRPFLPSGDLASCDGERADAALFPGLVSKLSAGTGKNGSLEDRKSTRLNSSHVKISYAVFCLKKTKLTRNQK